jgi:hypothetical protein
MQDAIQPSKPKPSLWRRILRALDWWDGNGEQQRTEARGGWWVGLKARWRW